MNEDEIASRQTPQDAVYVERREYGPFIGRPVKLAEGDRELAAGSGGVLAAASGACRQGANDRDAIRELERDEIGGVNYRIEQLRLDQRALDLEAAQAPGVDQSAAKAAIEQQLTGLQTEYAELDERLKKTREEAERVRVTLKAAGGEEKDMPMLDVFRLFAPNQLGADGSRRRLCEPPVGVPERRSARVEHRRRHFPGDFRHGDDGACS